MVANSVSPFTALSKAHLFSIPHGRRLALLISVLLLGCQATPKETPLEQLRAALQEQAKLLASDGADDERFGVAVALSGDGNTALIGAHTEDDQSGTTVDNGAAYVFVRAGATWVEQAKLLATGRVSDDLFGVSVALSADGNTALIGATGVDAAGLDSGAVYVFTRSGSTWTQEAQIVSDDLATADGFGQAVALSTDGSMALVGAPYVDTSMAMPDSGAAYVFRRSMTTWTQEIKLVPTASASSDYFGYSVAMSASGDRVLIGALSTDDSGSGYIDNGAAYVFRHDTGVWVEESKLWSIDRQSSDQLGITVSMSAAGDRALVGATFSDGAAGLSNSGAAYVFAIVATAWTQEARLAASDPAIDDTFGFGLGLSAAGDRAVVGSRFHDDDGKSNNGAAYAFIRTGSTWATQTKLLASDKESDDRFTRSLALLPAGNRVLIGAQLEDSGATVNQGAVYEFFLGNLNGTACAQNSECVTGYCIDGVCCDSACGGGLTNDCQACSAATKESGNGDGSCGAAKRTVVCRTANGVCDQAESCDGSNLDCPIDGKRSGNVCRQSIGACDMVDTCNGSSNDCLDAVKSAGTTCKAAGPSMICDPADVCDGQRKLCPGRVAAPGMVCGAGLTCKLNGVCS